MKRIVACLASVAILAMSMAVTSVLNASAFELTDGETYANIGTIQSASTTQNVAGVQGFTYTEATFTDLDQHGQSLYAMEFNPATTDLVPMLYQPKPAYGSRVSESVTAATAAGYEVVGGVNGEFFSMNSANYGMLTGRMITNGRVIVDSEDTNEMCLAIDSDGQFHLVKSQTQYIVSIDGVALNSGNGAISKINGRYVGTNWWDPMMYFDYATGGQTYSNADVKGVEVLCEKVDGTELMVENTLKGKVVSVGKDTYGTKMSENQFVLYAQSTSSYAAKLSSLKAGQSIEIFVDEMNADAQSAMKNAMTVTSATYPIVMDGVNTVGQITKDPDGLIGGRSQRTLIGIKADGTMVLMCTGGRGDDATNNYGFGLNRLANMMIALGCVDAVALDGGGSSNMQVNGETKFCTSDNGYIRPVGSSILVCKRNDKISDPTAKAALNAAIEEYAAKPQTTGLSAALTQARAVYANQNSVTGDYEREVMNLQAALENASREAKNLLVNYGPNTDQATVTTNADGSVSVNVASGVDAQNNGHGLAVNPNLTGLNLTKTKGTGFIHVVMESDVPFRVTTLDRTAGKADKWISFGGEFFNVFVPQGFSFTNGVVSIKEALVDGKEFMRPGTYDVYLYYGGVYEWKANNGDANWNPNDAALNAIYFEAMEPGSFTVKELSLVATESESLLPPVPENPMMLGDLNGDEAIDMRDAFALYTAASGGKTLTDEQFTAGDMNEDGDIDMRDAFALYKIASGG